MLPLEPKTIEKRHILKTEPDEMDHIQQEAVTKQSIYKEMVYENV